MARCKCSHDSVVIVCTKDRPKRVEHLLKSLLCQTTVPANVVVVDSSSSLDTKQVCQNSTFTDRGRITYLASTPGAPHQKNVGLDLIFGSSEFFSVRYVFFLDDDVEPNEDYFSNCIDIFEKNPSIECLGGFDPLAQPPKSGLLATAFFLGSNPEGGKVLKSGIATTAIPQSELTIVEWVPGGMQSFRAELVANNRFDARIRIHGDDVEFQTRICKPGAIATSSRLPVTHFSETLNKDSIKDETAYMDGFRLRLAREKRSGVTRWAVLYSTLALLIFTLLVGLSTGNKSRLSQTLGHAEFLRRWLLGKEVEQRVS